MGNGVFLCCSQKKTNLQGDLDIKNDFDEKDYVIIKSRDIIQKDSSEQNVIRTDSKNSSKNASLRSKGLKKNSLNSINKISIDETIANTKLHLMGELFFYTIVEIDDNGMSSGLRNSNDNIAIFGFKPEIQTGPPKCDFYINLKNDDKKNNDNVFKIYYDKNKKSYILYFIHPSLILYYKITDVIYFKMNKEYYLILGDIFVTINIIRNNANEKQINLRMELENEKPLKYTFKQSEAPIKIGRNKCTINIPKASISKLHGIIYYEKDLFYFKDANSTNGSSLLIKEDDVIKIKGEMNFKLENTPFTIKEVENDTKY
jgi:hypothetical protein